MNDIEIMTHEQAVSLQAVERYLLGELTEQQRNAFEAHYFDCAQCFEQAQLSQEFMHHARQVLDPRPEPGWLARILGDFRRPALAFVTAGLLCAVGIGVYQQDRINSLKGPRVESRYTVTGEARGSEKLVSVARSAQVGLRVEFQRESRFVSYQAQIVSEAGKVKFSVPVPADLTDDSVVVTLPADLLEAGAYKLIIYGVTADGQQIEAGHGGFELQFTK